MSGRKAAMVAAALAWAVAVWLGLAARDPEAALRPGPPAADERPETRRFSLLAVGDTGERLPWRPFFEGQRSVGGAMAEEDRRSPVDALVFLGDNFYPDGLLEHELIDRVRRLVRPYCRFADLSGPRSAEVADACGLAPEHRNPVPWLAVMGNHDWNTPTSPALQRGEVPRFLPRWSTNEGVADAVELTPGLSLVRVDSELVAERGGDEVRKALLAARGPLRIVAIHRPIAETTTGAVEPSSAAVREAVIAAGVPVQLVLAGHRHNLQIALLDLAHPGLLAVAGGGANARRFELDALANRRFGLETTGFARVDLRGEEGADGLLVTLFSAPRYPLLAWRGPRRVAAWWVEPSGYAYQAFP